MCPSSLLSNDKLHKLIGDHSVEIFQVGKDPSYIYTCSCNDGSQPEATKSGTVFVCPSQVRIVY